MRISPLRLVLAALVVSLPVPAYAATAHPQRAPRAAATVSPRSDHWEARVLALTNRRRAAHGVRPLRAAACPDRLAERWTRHMATTRVLEHQSLTPFFDCAGVSTAGENIADGFETPHALVSAWMHSPGHRANILNPHFHRIGVSGWRATDGVTYATQDFVG
jgi:uncharacterized protein YkwD